MSVRRFASAVLFSLFFVVMPAFAATSEFRLLLDVDRDAATGCTVSTMSGVEQVITTFVVHDEHGARVVATRRSVCAAGVMAPAVDVDVTGWPAVVASDRSVIESRVPLSVLGLTRTQQVRAGFVFSTGSSTSSILEQGGRSIILPRLASGRRRSALPASGDLQITLDGLVGDWNVDEPVAEGSGVLQRVYSYSSVADLYLRFEAVTGTLTVNPDSYVVRQGKILSVAAPGVLTNDVAPEGTQLSVASATQPNHGTLAMTAQGGFTYVHDGTSAPVDTFDYRATNGTAGGTGTVTIDVTPNGLPSAAPDSYQVAHRGTLDIAAPGVLANDSDPEGDRLRSALATPPANGTLVLDANGHFVYQHNGSDTRTDQFTYRASDGVGSSGSTTVSIAIGADAVPAAVADHYTVAEAATLSVDAANGVLANDTDADTPRSFWTASVVTPPVNGTLTLNADGSFTYVHNGGETTADSFTYRMRDGIADSAPVSVALTITAVNDVPVAASDSYATDEDTALTIAAAAGVLANDVDAEHDVLTATVVTPPTLGTLTLNANGSFTYTPNANANGIDTFTYRAADPAGAHSDATVTITVRAINDAPTFTLAGNPPAVSEDAGAQTVINFATAVSAGPGETEAVNFVIVSNNAASLFSTPPSIDATGKLTYTPAPDANGSATISVKLVDAGATAAPNVNESAPQTFTIVVNAVNDAPSYTAGADVTVNEDSSAYDAPWASAISAGPAEEPAAQTVSFNVGVDQPALFSAAPAIAANGRLTFTPASNAFGTATITVSALDSAGGSSSPQIFHITLAPINDAPGFDIASPVAAATEDGGPQTVSGFASSITSGPGESDALTFVVVSNDKPALFSATPVIDSTGTLTFTPAPDANGIATISVKLTDNGATGGANVNESAPRTFTINISAVNDPPVFTAPTTVNVAEDSGAYSAAFASAISAGPADETATQTVAFTVVNVTNASLFAVAPAIAPDGTLTFSAAPNAFGSSTVSYSAADSAGATTAVRTVTITITPVNDPPSFTISGDPATIIEDSGAQTVPSFATAISSGPLESESVSFTVVSNGNTALFAVQPGIGPDGTLTYTPAPDAFGSALIVVKLVDAAGAESSTQSFTITVTGVNDAPSFTKGLDQNLLEDAAPQAVAGWATAILAGPADENAQHVDFVVTNNNSALFSAEPVIDATGKLTYAIAADVSGTATVTVRAHDDGGTAGGGADTSAPQTFAITVKPVNDAPSFAAGANQVVAEDSGAAVVIGWASAVSAGANETSQNVDFVVTNDKANLFLVQPSVNAAGDLTFTPALNANGLATVTIHIHDDGGTADGGVNISAPQTFTITVSSVNDAPVAAADPSYTTTEDVPLTIAAAANGVLANDTDVENDSLTAVLVADAQHGSVSLGANGTFTYTPATEYFGTDTFTYKANDGADDSNVVTVTITVAGLNDAPVLTAPANASTNEDTQLTFAAANAVSVADVDAGSGPLHLTLSVAHGTLTLATTANLSATGNGTASLDVTGALADLNAALAGAYYLPAANYFGADAVTINVNDQGNSGAGGAKSDTKSVTLNVVSVNDAPLAANDGGYATDEDVPLVVAAAAGGILPNDNDVENDTLTAVLVTNALHGNVALSANGTFTYTPAADFFGSDSFTYKANDGALDSNVATVTITVAGTNDSPVIGAPANASTNEDTPLVLSAANIVSIGDVDAGSGAMRLTLGVSHGVVTLASTANLTVTGDGTAAITATGARADLNAALLGAVYTPAPNYFGADSLAITIDDQGNTGGGGAKNDARSIAITVASVNDAPIAVNDAGYTTDEEVALTVAVAANGVLTNDSDVEGSPLTAVLVAGAQHGTVVLNTDGTFTYTPAADFDGTDTFTYRANDGAASSNVATVSIAVAPVNDAPVITAPSGAAINEDSQLVLSGASAVSISDVDAGSGPLHLTLAATNGTITLATTASLTVTGNGGASVSATGPLASLNAALAGAQYTPTANFSGEATLDITIDDHGNSGTGGAKTDTRSVPITVSAVNDAPVANPDAIAVTEDQTPSSITGNLLANDTDADVGDYMYVAAVNGDPDKVWDVVGTPYGFFFVMDEGEYQYVMVDSRPALQGLASGTIVVDSLSYTIADTAGALSTSTFKATITGVNDAPVAADDIYAVPPSGTLNGTSVLANDVDVDLVPAPDPLTAILLSSTTQGTLTFRANGTFDYVKTCSPCAQDHDTFTYKINDTHADSNVGTVTINYNSPPVAVADEDYTVVEDMPLVTNAATGVRANDVDTDGDVTHVVVTTLPSVGTLGPLTTTALGDELPLDGSFTYTPPADFFGTVTFSYKLRDASNSESAIVTVTIAVDPINDAPSFTLPASPNLSACSGVGAYIPGFATNILAGPPNESQELTFIVTVDDPSLFEPGTSCVGGTGPEDPAVCTSSMSPVISQYNGDLSFAVKAGASGSTGVHVYLRDDGGTAAGGINQSPVQNFTLTIDATNHAPAFTPGPGFVTAANDGGQVSIAWAHDIDASDPGQTVSFVVTPSDASMFAAGGAPAISPTGQLTFTPATGASGTTQVEVVLRDDGSSVCGTRETGTFALFISLGATNHPPTFTLSTTAVNTGEGLAFADLPNFVTVTSPGAGDTGQTPYTVTITLQSTTNVNLFSLTPRAVQTSTTAFSLRMQPASGETGSAVLNVTVRDAGGVLYGGSDTSSQTFTVNVGSPNHAPVIIGASDLTVPANSAPQVWPSFVSLTSPGPGDPAQAPYSATITQTSTNNAGLFSSAPALAINPDGVSWTLTYTTAANQVGAASFSVTVKDSGGLTYGGSDQVTRTFTISVGGQANNPPFFTVTSAAINLPTGTGATTYTNFVTVTSPGSGDLPQTPYTVTIAQLSTTNASLFSSAPALTPTSGAPSVTTWNLGFTPAAAQSGSATFRITVKDAGGTTFGGSDTTTKDITIAFGAVNHPPQITVTPTTFNSNMNQSINVSNFLIVNGPGVGDPAQAPYDVNLAFVSATDNSLFTGPTANIHLVQIDGTTFNLQYTPATNHVGSATFKVSVTDSGGTTFGGSDTTMQSFTINVTGVVPVVPGVPSPAASKKTAVMAYPNLPIKITNAASDVHYRLLDDIVYTGSSLPLKAQIISYIDGYGTYPFGSGNALVTIDDAATGAFTYHPVGASRDLSETTPGVHRWTSQLFTFRVCDSAPTPVCSSDMNYSIDYSSGTGVSTTNMKVIEFHAATGTQGDGTAERPFVGGVMIGPPYPEVTCLLRKGTYTLPSGAGLGLTNVTGEGYPGLTLASLGVTPLAVGTVLLPTPLSTNVADTPKLIHSAGWHTVPGVYRNLIIEADDPATNPNFGLAVSSGVVTADRIRITGGSGFHVSTGATLNITNSSVDVSTPGLTALSVQGTMVVSSTTASINCSTCVLVRGQSNSGVQPVFSMSSDSSMTITKGDLFGNASPGTYTIDAPITIDKSGNSEDGLSIYTGVTATYNLNGPVHVTTNTMRPIVISGGVNSWFGSPNPAPTATLTLAMPNGGNFFHMLAPPSTSGFIGVDLLTFKVGAAGMNLSGLALNGATVTSKNTNQGTGTITIAGTLSGSLANQKCIGTDLSATIVSTGLTATNCTP